MERTRKILKAYADYCTKYNIVYQHPHDINLEKHEGKTYFVLRSIKGLLAVIDGDFDQSSLYHRGRREIDVLRCLDPDDWPETIKND